MDFVKHSVRFALGTLIFFLFLNPSFSLFCQERSLDVQARFDVPRLDVPTRLISDDSALRISLMDTWFTEPPQRTLNRKAELYKLSGGDHIEIRTEAGKDEIMVILARGRNGNYRGYTQGSWILNRSLND